MPKVIKFDLPIDGIRAKNIEEIRDHFTLEILAHFRSGLLAKWLAVRKLNTELEALQAIDTSVDDQAVFKRLCEIFAVEADDAVIAVLLNDPMPKLGLTVAEVVKQAESADKVINLADLLPIQAGELKLFTERALIVDLLADGTDLIFQSAQGSLIFKSCRIVKTIGRYCDLGDGTVLDKKTKLQWMRCALGQTWTWTCNGNAKEYNRDAAHSAAKELNQLGYAGQCDWRLPSKDELNTLIVSGQQPCIDQQAFPNTPSSHCRSDSSWCVKISDGYANNYDRNVKGHIRLVRGGQ